MAAVDDPKTLGRTRLSFASEADIDEFVATLEKFENGDLTPDQWRMFRLVRGTYGQRQPGDVQMLRIKIPQGVLTAPQLEALAVVGERFSRGFGHITTRQNIQFHFVKLHDVEAAMRILADAGLTTREACGNSVRNITCCPKAGVSPTELFDVTPYSEAMTRYLLRHPLSSSLPRKFKIAFEGCTDQDHALLGMHDLGYRAAIKDGRRGFRVVVGGGTSIMVKSAEPVHDFLPASDIFNVAEAVIRVFHEFGDYKHKQANRLKFLIKKLGWDGFLAEYHNKLAEFRDQGGATLPFDPENPPVETEPAWRRIDSPPILQTVSRATSSQVTGPGIVPQVRPMLPTMNGDYSHWLSTNVSKQKQSGYFFVNATIPLGDFTSQQMRILGDLATAFADGTIRITAEQNLVFRWVPTDAVPELYRQLAAAGMGLPDAGTIADVTSCPGAESCKLAVTRPGQISRRAPSRASGAHRDRARSANQDQRMPERMRAASHRRPRIPGQRAQSRRQGHSAVFRDGRRRPRRRRCALWPSCRKGAGAPDDRRTRAAVGVVRERSARRRVRHLVLSTGRCRASERRTCRPRADDAGHDRGRRLCRSRRNRRIQAGNSGRGMQRVKTVVVGGW
jgi:sulfite reductase (ferredoxin)